MFANFEAFFKGDGALESQGKYFWEKIFSWYPKISTDVDSCTKALNSYFQILSLT